MFDKIHQLREKDRHHLKLCNDMCFASGGTEPAFSLGTTFWFEMMAQQELMDTKLGTLPATFDMCHVGGLQLPQHDSFLQKRTEVFTTSRHLFELLNYEFCKKNHVHVPIKGKTKIKGNWVQISSYARAYTAGFARKVARGLREGTLKKEHPLVVDEMILGLEEHEKPDMAPEALQLQKRRRVNAKQPETSLYGKAPTWEAIFRTVGYQTPRVGNFYFDLFLGQVTCSRAEKSKLWLLAGARIDTEQFRPDPALKGILGEKL